MPILPAEPDCHPPDLWKGDHPGSLKEGARWWCLHARPRQEKAIARDLRLHDVAFYLPQVFKEGRTPQGRKTRSIVPLFSGYVFLHGDENDRLLALRGDRLVSVLEVHDQLGFERDLRQIHTMLSAGLLVSPEPAVPVGALVRITTGPLQGMTGQVLRRGQRDEFVATVHFLGRGARVDLQDWQVEIAV